MPDSRADKMKEIVKCGRDPVYFINTYVKIQHPEKGRISFKTYDFQDDIVKSLQKNRFNIVLKSRQLGLSTVAAAYALWYAIFYKDKNILIIATKLESAINFIKKVKIALQAVPEWLLLPTYTDNKRSVSFSNGSQITAIPTSEDAGRSESLSLLIVDEAAFIKDFENLWAGLFPTISTGGNALIISTPYGVGGQFYRLWTEGEAGLNGFIPTKLPWWVHPEHDEAWFIKETKNLPKRKVAQEFLCEFETSGETFLQNEIMFVLKQTITPPIEKTGPQNNIWIWKHPEINKRYVISADVSRGDAADFSTFHIVDADDCEVVAEYMGKIPPEKFGSLIAEWGYKYNTALASPENNSFGYFTCVTLRDNGYPKLYYVHRKGDPFSYSMSDPDKLPGFSTQGNTRNQIMTKLEELLRNGQLKTYSQRLFDQLQTFVWQGTKPQAMKDNHDDLVISLAIAGWLVGGSSGKRTTSEAMATAILSGTSVNRTMGMPGGVDDVRSVRNPHYMGITPSSIYRPIDPSQVAPDVVKKNSDLEDFSWLL